MKWINQYSKDFERDALRKLISKVNWKYLKPSIKSKLSEITAELQKNGIEVELYDHADEPTGWGFDYLNLQFRDKLTGNMRQFVEEKSLKFNHHMQKGCVMAITYSSVGHIHIIISPSTSDDSLAVHSPIILYHTYDAGTITNKKLEKFVRYFIRYQRFTGVLHRKTLMDRCIISWLKMKMYFIQYLEPKEKFTRYSALYIPLISMIVATVAAVASLIAVYLTYLTLKP